MRILKEINGCHLCVNRGMDSLDHKPSLLPVFQFITHQTQNNNIHKNCKLSNLKRESRHVGLWKTKFNH